MAEVKTNLWERMKPRLGWLFSDEPVILSRNQKHRRKSSVPDQPQTPTQRVQRLYDMCCTGQLAIAELELFDWRQQEELPPDGQVLLASLLARRGNPQGALEVLDDQSLCPSVMQMRITLYIALGQKEKARQTARELYHESGQNSQIALWLQAVQAPGYELFPPVSQTQVEQLACELYMQPRIIRSLVIAQKLRCDLRRVRLLRDALQRLACDITDQRQQLIICEGLAELSLLLGEQQAAAQWAHRGLKIDPLYAPLALVLSQLEDTEAQPKAREVLEQTLAEHPTYRDIRMALIRRLLRDGEHQAAVQRLEQWKLEDPQHPAVHELEMELAA